MNKWISVDTKLPEKDQEILCFNNYEMFVCIYDQSGFCRNSWQKFWPKHNGCGCCISEINPTHWMPLPKGPEDQTI